MSTVANAIDRSRGVSTTALQTALHLKQGGFLNISPPAGMDIFSNWKDQGANRERYGLFRGWLYAAINALASEGAGQPAVVAKLKGSRQKPKEQKSLVRSKMTVAARTKSADKEFEIIVDHQLLDILERPNPIQTRWTFTYSFIANLCLTGWSYIVGGENEDGEWEFYSIPTTWVRPDHEEGPFSRFKINDPANPAAGEGEWLTRENVAFAMLPNPMDPRIAMAPAQSQIDAIRIDDYIQASQAVFFENGIFPGAIVTIGKDPHPDVPGGIRPRLTATQRRQVTGAIRKVMGGVANYGNPAIVDGMIESIERLSMTSNEMGWEKSEDKVRTRILSAFGVHPYILGEPVGVGGYAQVVNIEKRFYKRVNTFLDMLGAVVTEFVADVVEEDAEDLFVWWEQCESVDPSLRWSNLNAARGRGDVSRNEIRTELGLPPDESGGEMTKLYSAGDINAIIAVQKAIAEGAMEPEQAREIYRIAYDMDPADAKKVAGKKPPAPKEPPPGPPGSPVPGAPPPADKLPPTEPEAVSGAAGALEKAVAALGLSVSSDAIPKAVAKRIIEVARGEKFNPNRDELGRFAEGDGGGGTSPGGAESYNTRIEGTQKEADREVTRAKQAVSKADAALQSAKDRIAATAKAKMAEILAKKLGEVKTTVSAEEQKLAASRDRIAALKAQLAAMKKSPSEQDLAGKIDAELQAMKSAVERIKKAADELDEITAELEKL